MGFRETLNDYLGTLHCTSKELAVCADMSEAVISRYRSGERTPKADSEQTKKLAAALFALSEKTGTPVGSEADIAAALTEAIEGKEHFDYDSFSARFNALIVALGINVNEMAKAVTFDASHLSRIRYGKTRPSDPTEFCRRVCDYVVSRYAHTDHITALYPLLALSAEEAPTEEMLAERLSAYLLDGPALPDEKEPVGDFLRHLDSFRLDDYIKVIHFDSLKVPNIPFYRPKSRNYYGIEGMKAGELDFFKGAVLSKSTEEIFMCSDMPMEDMAEDVEFGKKWMFAIAMSLKKGLHLNIIHNLDRPFAEMMLGLESWAPIYMTGQISPFYLKEMKNSPYRHLNYVCGKCALTGECIEGHHADGKYYLATDAAEVAYYKKKAALLLKKARPLMEIFTAQNRALYEIFLRKDAAADDDRKRTLHSLPLFTMSDALLADMLKRHALSDEQTAQVLAYKKAEKTRMETILQTHRITDTVCLPDRETFEACGGATLALEDGFFEQPLSYTFEEYTAHAAQTKAFVHENYAVRFTDHPVFGNISITAVGEQYVVLSKCADPVIHFVIRHPKLTAAIRAFRPAEKYSLDQ